MTSPGGAASAFTSWVDLDTPTWDAPLKGCAKRVHIATLGVGNPDLTRLPLTPSFAEIHFMGFRAPPVPAKA